MSQKVPCAAQDGRRQIPAVVQQRREDAFGKRHSQLVSDREPPRRPAAVAAGEQQAVAREVIASQRTLAARGGALLVKNGRPRVVDDPVTRLADALRPVQLLVVEEILLGHRSRFLDRLAPYHHRRAVGVGRRVRRVPGAVVGLPEPDEGVAQGNARQGCVACELDRLRGRPEADFGADGPDRRIGVECLREVMQRVVPDLRVVVEQQEAVARGGPDAEVDELFLEAVRIAIDVKQISASYLQRKLGLGYSRASRIIDQMEEKGYISARDGNNPRHVLISSLPELPDE